MHSFLPFHSFFPSSPEPTGTPTLLFPDNPRQGRESLLPDGEEQTIADVAEAGIYHASGSKLLIEASNPDVDAGGPLGRGAGEAVGGAELLGGQAGEVLGLRPGGNDAMKSNTKGFSAVPIPSA